MKPIVRKVVLCAIAGACAGGSASAAVRGDLEPEHPVEEQLVGGEAHSYRIAIEEGQFLDLSAEELGSNVGLRLASPGGDVVVERNRNRDMVGVERLLWIARVAGDYEIRVEGNPDQSVPGRYRLSMERLRIPREEDRANLAGQQAENEAVRLQDDPSANNQGLTQERWAAAIEGYRQAGNVEGQVRCLLTLGVLHGRQGNSAGTLEVYEKALGLSRAAAFRPGEARSLNNLGAYHWGKGNYTEGLRVQDEALAIWRELGSPQGQAAVLHNRAGVYNRLGDNQQALHDELEALSLWQKTGLTRPESDTLADVAVLYEVVGNRRQAIECLDRALEMKRAARDIRGEALVHRQTASILAASDPQRALDSARESLRLFREQAVSHQNEAYVLSLLGFIHCRLGSLDQATDLLQQGLALARARGYRREEISCLVRLGNVESARGGERKALERYAEAIAVVRQTGSRGDEARVLIDIGDSRLALGEVEPALESYGLALATSRAASQPSVEARSLYGLARVARRQGLLADARTHIESALALVESMRVNMAADALRARHLSSVRSYFELYVDILMAQARAEPAADHAAHALRASENSRARGLLETLAAAGVDLHAGAASELVDRERALEREINSKARERARLLSGPHDEAALELAGRELRALTAEQDGLRARIRERSPAYASLIRPEPAGLSEIQREALDTDTALLEYALGDERSYLWVVTSSSFASFELPRRADIEAAARRFYEVSSARGRVVRFETPSERRLRIAAADRDLAQAGRDLYEKILKPAHGHLNRRRLVVVADGALQYVPFAALPLGPSPLVGSHEIVGLPSASALLALRRADAGRLPPPRRIAILADPVFEPTDPRVRLPRSASAAVTTGVLRSVPWEDADRPEAPLPRLPGSRREAERISGLFPPSERVLNLGFDANRDAASAAALSDFGTIHFATHAVLDAVHPELSGIALSMLDADGNAQDGLVRLHEIYNMRLSADLVVLSACRTALGAEVRGEGVDGLTRGFLHAGARRVLSSLWKVDDDATAELMHRFYAALGRGDSDAAGALREAQTAMVRTSRWASPYYWAGFVLQGDWKKPAAPTAPRPLR